MFNIIGADWQRNIILVLIFLGTSKIGKSGTHTIEALFIVTLCIIVYFVVTVLKELHGYMEPFSMTSDGIFIDNLSNMISRAVTKFQATPLFEMTYSSIQTNNGNQQYGLKVRF